MRSVGGGHGGAEKGRWYRSRVIESDEHQLFRKTLRDLFEREVEPHVDEWEAARTFPAHDLFPKLASVGLLGLEYDEVYGGMGADHSYSLIAGEEMGRISCGGVPMAMAVQMSMATPALARYGSDELKERYLAPAIRGEVVTSIAVTEPDAGSDVAGIRTRAVRDGDEWVINGAKLYITNGTQADWLCLLARTSDDPGSRGMSLIIVPTDVSGVVVSRKLEKLGMWSSDTAELSFTDVRVPVANTIGDIGRGFQQQMVQFQAERLMTFYKQVGSIELALERTKAYLRERRAFGAPLLANQHLQFVLAELSARHDVLKEYARTTADAVLRGEDATRYATIGKLLGSRFNARSPTSQCSSTAVWATWTRTGPRATSATHALTPSVRAPTRSCSASWRAWTATRSSEVGGARPQGVRREVVQVAHQDTTRLGPRPLDVPEDRLASPAGDETTLLGPHTTGPRQQAGMCHWRMGVEQQPVGGYAGVLERGVEVETRRNERWLQVHVWARTGWPAADVEHNERACCIHPRVREGGGGAAAHPGPPGRSKWSGGRPRFRPVDGSLVEVVPERHWGPVLVRL